MNGCSSESAVIVNAEVDSMGGVIDSGDGIGGSKCSLRLTAFERAQVELRQEYDFREKSRRELEFLEKGGNPLDFKFGGGASLSVQSTSLTDQHRENVVTSEAKDSFVLTASPHGDSVESSGRPGIPTVSEPNTADNLFLLDGKNESRESERKLTHTTKKSCIIQKEHGSQMNVTQNAKESEDSAIVRPYARRNRSKINRDSARSNSAAMIHTRGSSHGFLHTRGAPKAKSTSEVNNQKEQNIIVVGNNNRKSTTSNGYIGSKLATSDTQMNMELECAPSKEVTNYKTNDSGPEAKIDTPSGGPNSSAEIGMQGLNSESPCTQNSLTVDVNNGSDMCINPKVADSNEFPLEQGSELEGIANVDLVKEKNDIFEAEVTAIDNNDVKSVNQNRSVICPIIKLEKEANRSTPDLQNGLDYFSKVNAERNDNTISETDRRMDIPVSEPEASVSGRKLIDAPYAQMGDKAYEDSILEQARIIEAKQKSVAELSAVMLPIENHQKNHWYFVLEEMAWLANDFAQERLWKMTAASQICRRVALASRLRFEGKTQCLKLKQIAYVLAKDVMRFWHSAEMLRNTDHPISGVKSCRQDVSVDEPGVQGQEAFKENALSTKTQAFAVQKYAERFLVSNSDSVPTLQAEAQATPDRKCDLATAEISWDEYRNEESLFYAVPSGAMKTYRESIKSHFMQCEKTASSIQEEVETSTYDAPGEMRYQAPGYDEDEGEASAYYLSGGFEGRKSIKSPHKKRKKPYNSRTYEIGTDLPYGHCPNEAQQSVLTLKRPAGSLHVDSLPTKRVRTASRQRIVGPFNGGIQVPIKKDASSGDTNSFQDDQCTQNGGSQFQKSMEVELVGGDFEKQLPYDCAETSTKPKKKKKPKTMGTSYEQGWQLDASVHNEQRDQSRRRLDSDNFESNGTGGLNGQHGVKKPKIMKQQVDTTLDNMNMGSIPSPAASQMSNMPNPSKLIQLISGRDRGIKTKGLKASSEQPGSGSPWFLFEDQALVVLVHDMGPNWELVSDALNSTLQFKCIYRKPKECKERYKIFTDRSGGDGADSAEDSGSSQSYTLTGIPKGSARQLFRHLQSPMEEDTLRAHFEKIISIGKKQHQRKRQNENQDSKQMTPVHNSHLIALSQVCSNNLNGGLLTPLDLCDAASSPDGAPFGYHGGAAIANQGGAASVHPSPVANPSLQATPDMLLSNSSPSPSGSLAPPMRDGRYNSPRTPLPVDEQQRMQQCNQMFSARSLQQTNLSVPGADRGVRMLPGGNGMGMMVNRSLPMPRPGLRGIPSPSGGSMLSSNVVGMPNPVNKINSGAGSGSGQGRSVLRPGEPLHMMRPGQNGEHHQRQLMAPEVQMQGNGQGMAAFNGLSYQGHPHPQHQLSPRPLINPHLQGPNNTAGAQHQYAARLAKHRRHMQQQQFASTSPPMQHAASQPPVSAPPMSAMSSQEHHLTPQGLNRNPKTVAGSGLTNQMGKQRQRQQLQQSGRHHPQQQQSQQQLKVLKGNGKNLSVDPSNRLNGLSSPPGNQSMEKGDQTIPSMPGQGLYAGSIRPSKPLPSPLSSNIHSRPLQKLYSAPTPALKLDNCSSPSRITFSDRHQTVLPPITKQPLPRQLTQTHSAVQRVLQPNSQENSDLLGKSQVDELSRPDSAPVSSESVYNSGKSNVTTQSSSNGSPPRASSSNSDLVPNVGLERRQLSDSLPSPGHNVGPQSQDEQKPPQQLPLEQETQ
ncbi:hypothetical protein ACFE04_002920 [Oxalis oulophora]